MTRILVYTHLQAEDKFLFGLTLVQALTVVVALLAGIALSLVTPATWPAELRFGLGTVVVGVGVTLAAVMPGGRGLDDWAGIVLAYWLRPRRLRWRKGDHQ